MLIVCEVAAMVNSTECRSGIKGLGWVWRGPAVEPGSLCSEALDP